MWCREGCQLPANPCPQCNLGETPNTPKWGERLHDARPAPLAQVKDQKHRSRQGCPESEDPKEPTRGGAGPWDTARGFGGRLVESGQSVSSFLVSVLQYDQSCLRNVTETAKQSFRVTSKTRFVQLTRAIKPGRPEGAGVCGLRACGVVAEGRPGCLRRWPSGGDRCYAMGTPQPCPPPRGHGDCRRAGGYCDVIPTRL